MRVAVGVDIVEVARVRRLLADNPAAEREIFTPYELGYCASRRHRLAHLAARFAAKEALLKALGTGLGPGMRWTDVAVHNDQLGRPRLELAGQAAERVRSLSAQPAISISHTQEHAIAHVVLLIPTELPVAW